jgi:mono/diheme cytochrome c family protein
MKKVFKYIGYTLGGLIFLLILLFVFVYASSTIQINKQYDIKPSALKIPSDSSTIKNGERLYVLRGCTYCHGIDLSGKTIMSDPLLGVIAGPNLTKGKGGLPADYSDQDYVRAIRHGVGRSRKGLMYMSAEEFYYFNDKDLSAIIAYIKTIPQVDNVPETNVAGPLMRLLFLMDKAPIIAAKVIDHNAPRPADVKEDTTAEYGHYMSISCADCHGAGLSGGEVPAAPPGTPLAPNITFDKKTGIGNWSKEDFAKAMRAGIRPNGKPIDPFMPWQNFSRMTDVELNAMWVYLRSLPQKSFGEELAKSEQSVQEPKENNERNLKAQK